MKRVGQRQGSAMRSAAGRAADFIRKAGDFLLPPEMFAPPLVPAYAGCRHPASGTRQPVSGFQFPGPRTRNPKPQTPRKGGNAVLFDSGPAPQKGTPSRRLMDWEASIGVLEAKDAREPYKLQMGYEEAQSEVSAILRNPRAVHSYITAQAAKMYNDDPLVRKHFWHLVVGALAEDYSFMPGESLSDISGNPKGLQDALGRFREASGRRIGMFNRMLLFVARAWNSFTGRSYDDPADRPYWAHFFRLTSGMDGEGLTLLGGELRFQGALERLAAYWRRAAAYYYKGDTPRAFCCLGHAVHLVQDLHVPAHVHNDPHGPTFFLGGEDSFEKWAARADYPSVTRGRGDSNASIWDSSPFAPPAADRSWNNYSLPVKLSEFAIGAASGTQKFRSVDAKGVGDVPYQDRSGPLTESECYEQGRVLIPAAIMNTARLIINFVDFVRRNGQPAEQAPAPPA